MFSKNTFSKSEYLMFCSFENCNFNGNKKGDVNGGESHYQQEKRAPIDLILVIDHLHKFISETFSL